MGIKNCVAPGRSKYGRVNFVEPAVSITMPDIGGAKFRDELAHDELIMDTMEEFGSALTHGALINDVTHKLLDALMHDTLVNNTFTYHLEGAPATIDIHFHRNCPEGFYVSVGCWCTDSELGSEWDYRLQRG